MSVKWTDGTEFTEDGLFVDGRLSKLGSKLVAGLRLGGTNATMENERPGWPTGAVLPAIRQALQGCISPELGSESHQVFANRTGRLVSDIGLTLGFTDVTGFAEESRQLW